MLARGFSPLRQGLAVEPRAASRSPGLLRRQIGALLVSAGERLHGQALPQRAEPAC